MWATTIGQPSAWGVVFSLLTILDFECDIDFVEGECRQVDVSLCYRSLDVQSGRGAWQESWLCVKQQTLILIPKSGVRKRNWTLVLGEEKEDMDVTPKGQRSMLATKNMIRSR